jgi:predicted nucleic acid-binding protein
MAIRRLGDVSDGLRIFVDTNILVYHLLEDELYGTSCRTLTRYQLLPADSVDAALIRRHDLPALATRDDDFDHVESLDVYKP